MRRRPAWLLHQTTHESTRRSLSFPEREKKHVSVMDWVMFPPDPCAEALTLYVTRLETEPFKKEGRSPEDGALVQEDWSLGRGRDTRLLSHKGKPREESSSQARKRSLLPAGCEHLYLLYVFPVFTFPLHHIWPLWI